MPKFLVEYGLDVPAYGTIEIEAAGLPELRAEIKRLHEAELLVGDYTTQPDVGVDNHRIVHAFLRVEGDPTGKLIENFQFGLDEDEDYYEQGKYVHIAYNKKSNRIDASSDSPEDISMFNTDDYVITKARL
jgi:hypothetical protein